MLAYEKTGYDTTQPGRLPDLLDDYSVRRIVAAGADCVKILLYYTPFDPAAINEAKHAWVERIGAECQASDVPFFLEFVVYDEKLDEKSIEFARKKPSAVTGSMEEFSKPQYGVDIMKVEVPVNMSFVAGSRACKGESAYSRDEAKDLFRKAGVCREETVHLSFCWSQQRSLQRNARYRRRIRHSIFRRSLRTRNMERCHAHLRQAGS